MNYGYALLLSIIIISNYCNAASSFEVSFGAGNLSQFQKPFDDFYLNNLHITSKPNLYSAGTVTATDLKYSINAGISFNKKYKLQIGFSTGEFKRKITSDTTSFSNAPFISEEHSQQITEWNISFSRLIHFEKSTFCIGFETPIFLANTFKYSSLNKLALFSTLSSSGSYSYYANINETLTIPGGSVFGVNLKASVQYSFCNWLYVFGGGHFGLLKSNLGGRSNYSFSYSNPNSNGTGAVIDNSRYKTTYVSSPALEFGLGFIFEKIVSDKR